MVHLSTALSFLLRDDLPAEFYDEVVLVDGGLHEDAPSGNFGRS